MQRNLIGILTLLLFISNSLHGQDQKARLDSFLNLLQGTFESDSLHARAYEDVILYYIEQTNGREAFPYLDSVKQFSAKVGYGYGEWIYEFNTAYHYFRRGIYDSVFVHMGKIPAIADKLKLPRKKIEAYNRMAIVCNIQGRLDSSRFYLNKAITIANELGELQPIVENLNTLGSLEFEAGNYLISLSHFIKVDSLYSYVDPDEINYYRLATALQNIGILQFEQLNDAEKGLTYLRRAKSAYGKSHPSTRNTAMSSSDLVIARILAKQNKLAQADSILTTILPVFRIAGHAFKIAETASFQGGLKLRLGNEAAAEQLLREAEQRFEQLENRTGSVNIHQQLGRFYAKTNDYDRSIAYFKSAFAFGPVPDVHADLLEDMSGVYAQIGNYRAAYDSLSAYVKYSDSLNRNELESALQEAEIKYQSSQKEKEIVDLQLTQSNQRIRNQRIIAAGLFGLVALSALSYLYFYRARQRKKINDQLKSIDELKSKLFSDISHEFRTPLALIRGPAEVLSRRLEKQGEVHQELEVIGRNATKLNDLVDSVQNLAKLDTGKIALQIRPCNLKEHLKIIGASFESMALSKGLIFDLNLNLSDELYYYDPSHLETILYNLLSNAFKFTAEGKISLQAGGTNGLVRFEVLDTGVGLTEAQQQKIFHRYYRVNSAQNSVEGIGIGLALASELAKLHLGTLAVQSELNQGSKFTLEVPISREFYETRSYGINSEFEPMLISQVTHKTVVDTQASSFQEDEAVILIVEDNPDMRQHLESLFQDEYSIISASDGQDGLNKALSYIPDIIISDLMMPVMDGQDFLRAIKTDAKTSHIPFIMLTANHLEQERIKGLQQRVDDYMTKPFSIDEIRLKVNNLIHLREQLRLRFQESREEDQPDIQPINETEQRFWRQLNEVVQKNLDNSNFSAEDFAKAMFMSRMQLHRKLKALTNLSTTIFLRTERLKVAKKMLQKPDAIVANVAYDVGFSSPSFFSKCFKEQFGVTPKEC